jgi:peptidoglycan/LPS O-acetylase OafA/YrhL
MPYDLANYTSNKLDILFPDITNILIMLVFFAAAALTVKRETHDEGKFLGSQHTDQLRGLAILLVILGHLWVHVARTPASLVLSDDAVASFLVISGFGITMSNMRRISDWKEYSSKRLKRVMVPYWIATIIILIMDYLVLGSTLTPHNMLLTFLGINIRIELLRLDYVRWFVTFIVMWYILFFIVRQANKHVMVVLLAAAGFLLFPINYYIFKFSWYQFLAFPAGCALAVYRDRVAALFGKNRESLLLISFIGIFWVIVFKSSILGRGASHTLSQSMPTIVLVVLSEINSLIITAGIIFLSGHAVKLGYSSRLLAMLGRYSYELFLIHGVFLVKYNPIISQKDPFPLMIQFILFICFVLVFSWLVSRVSRVPYEKLVPAAKWTFALDRRRIGRDRNR